jgi:hypothetical protein
MGEWKIDAGYSHMRTSAPRPTPGYKQTWCNVYGGESSGPSDVRNLGGLGRPPDKKQDTNWFCDTVAVGRFIMVCEHGHKGQIMDLCGKHVERFSDGKVTFCPRCNVEPPGHKCRIDIRSVS